MADDRDIQAIPTMYNGVEYRSALEAKWAAFFEQLDLKDVAYEPQAFYLGGGDFYLPDFHLKTQRAWIEIKPRVWLSELKRSQRVAQKLSVQQREPVLIIYGQPYDENYAGHLFVNGWQLTVHYLTTCRNCGLLHWSGRDEFGMRSAGPLGLCCPNPQPLLGANESAPQEILWAYMQAAKKCAEQAVPVDPRDQKPDRIAGTFYELRDVMGKVLGVDLPE